MVKAKGSYGNGLGEERSLLITPCVGLREYAETLEAGGQPPPQKLYQRSDGRHVAQVIPQGYAIAHDTALPKIMPAMTLSKQVMV